MPCGVAVAILLPCGPKDFLQNQQATNGIFFKMYQTRQLSQILWSDTGQGSLSSAGQSHTVAIAVGPHFTTIDTIFKVE